MSRKLNLTDEEKKYLTEMLSIDTKNDKTKIISNIILMYTDNIDINNIIQQTGKSKRTILNYISKFKKERTKYIDNLINKKVITYVSELDKYVDEIAMNFKETRNITSLKKAAQRIEELYGIKRTEQALNDFFEKHNFKKENGVYIKSKKKQTKKKNIKISNDDIEKYKINKNCPACSSNDVIKIVYGEPTDKLNALAEIKKIYLGDNSSKNKKPIYYCNDCHCSIYNDDEYELEMSLKNLIHVDIFIPGTNKLYTLKKQEVEDIEIHFTTQDRDEHFIYIKFKKKLLDPMFIKYLNNLHTDILFIMSFKNNAFMLRLNKRRIDELYGPITNLEITDKDGFITVYVEELI